MKRFTAIALALAVIGAGTLSAQETAYYRVEGGMLGAGVPVQDRVVTGAPYSAQYINEFVQTLSDGNRIVRRTTGRVYRDSEGRVRRETDRPNGEPLVTITDPVAKTSVTLDPATRTARSSSRLYIVDLQETVDSVRALARTLEETTSPRTAAPQGMTGGGRGGGAGAARGRRPDPNTHSEEKLAEKSVEGVTATGLRRTTTVPAGSVGNERPIQVVSEQWTSTELQVLVNTTLDDPRTGRTTYRLFAISRGNPPRSYFEIPPDYTVRKEPAPEWSYRERRDDR